MKKVDIQQSLTFQKSLVAEKSAGENCVLKNSHHENSPLSLSSPMIPDLILQSTSLQRTCNWQEPKIAI